MKCKVCCWNIVVCLCAALMMFTVGLLVGALFAPLILTLLPLFISLVIVWFAVLIIIGIMFYLKCCCC